MLTVCLSAVACQRPAEETAAPVETVEVASPEEGGALSTAPVEEMEQAPAPAPATPAEEEVDWSPLTLRDGNASVSCELDYATHGDGEPLQDLEHEALTALLSQCAERGVVRVRFKGRVTQQFTQLMQRLAVVSDELSIDKRVLDIDSSGGMVEEAIRAGDAIAESGWTIWVREGAVCHSACVFVLAGGDNRLIGGRVGIHRIIRMSSSAATRAELNRELRAVYGRVRDYLERNGAAVAVADLMMAVPNRSLRILTADELKLYGLDGVNPAQDDLDRLRLMRKCGQDFVARRDAFVRAFDARCNTPETDVESMNTCGLELRGTFGFPDETCPAESPLSEFDLVGQMHEAASNATRLELEALLRKAAPSTAPPGAAVPPVPGKGRRSADSTGQAGETRSDDARSDAEASAADD
ncbi:hypothetical protein LDO26_08650 [Luteimonas sp. BDR2-5]|nr:hypothetical protein [Luteimonas sp. BDR2-5]MCD9028278.1 hypothetical protein [Luteimonas sp. BDR2-5]